jgi:hypothetical protein
MNKKFIYKDVSKPTPAWPFFGEEITTITAAGITEADKIFTEKFPQHTKKGTILSNVTVSIQPPAEKIFPPGDSE